MLWQLLRRFKTSGSLRCLVNKAAKVVHRANAVYLVAHSIVASDSSMLEKLPKECADKAAANIVKDAALPENLKRITIS